MPYRRRHARKRLKRICERLALVALAFGVLVVFILSLSTMGDISKKAPQTGSPKSSMERLFRRFDIDGDGKLLEAEFRHLFISTQLDSSAIFTRATKEEVKKLFTTYDTNGDEALSRSEFKLMSGRLLEQ